MSFFRTRGSTKFYLLSFSMHICTWLMHMYIM